ncbi:MAG: nucleotidyltransferase family protein [Solirubrobacteraceae bacterium]
MAGRVDVDRLAALLTHTNLTVLLGRRVLALETTLNQRLRERVDTVAAAAERRGTTLELITLAIIARLEQAGIPALPLKGSILARGLYGDVAARASIDIDILVSPKDLSATVEIVRRMGWRCADQPRWTGALPLLHETMVHPEMPRIELHWRVHWYESRFASDALDRASRPGPAEPLSMQPQDGLATLILLYARDGLAGLRLAADVAAWWDEVCGCGDCDIELVAAEYPSLAAPLLVGSAVLAQLVGVPGRVLDRAPLRWRLAAEMATPFYAGGLAQVKANTSLVDLLLAPPGGMGESLRREAGKPLDELARSGKRHRVWARLRQSEHMLRVARRWLIAIVSALARLARRRYVTGHR